MNDAPFVYVLTQREAQYWSSAKTKTRNWFRAEIRCKTVEMARSADHSAWVIFSPAEACLEKGACCTWQ